MLLRKAYRFRIYPDAAQEELFRRTIGCCRLVYNLCLDQKNLDRERSRPRKLTAYDQINQLPDLKQHLAFLKEVPAQSLQQEILDLHKGISNFFDGQKRRRDLLTRGIKADPESFPRWPTFHKRGRKESFRFPDPKHTSIVCSECEAIDPESRITRDRFVCTDCHKLMDADVNAARNILAFGISPTGGHPGMACGSSQITGRKQEEDSREGRSSALQSRE